MALASEIHGDWATQMILADVALYFEAIGDLGRAVELASLVAGHSSNWVFPREKAKKLLARVAPRLSPQDFAAAQERGAELDVVATVNELLEDLKQ